MISLEKESTFYEWTLVQVFEYVLIEKMNKSRLLRTKASILSKYHTKPFFL
jgi:hypothetical protein